MIVGQHPFVSSWGFPAWSLGPFRGPKSNRRRKINRLKCAESCQRWLARLAALGKSSRLQRGDFDRLHSKLQPEQLGSINSIDIHGSHGSLISLVMNSCWMSTFIAISCPFFTAILWSVDQPNIWPPQRSKHTFFTKLITSLASFASYTRGQEVRSSNVKVQFMN